jgi:hypothetical protein
MDIKKINRVLVEMDDWPETMSLRQVATSNTARQNAASQKLATEAAATKSKRACTIDGITIYESVTALGAALGHGKDGTLHPDFKYLTDNVVKRKKAKPRTAEHNAKIGAARAGKPRLCKPVTIDDGVTIYPSVKALIEAYGCNSKGKSHPNRRFLTPEELKKWKEEQNTKA